MALRDQLRETFDLEPTRFSPLDGLGGLVSSQAWLTCHPK